MQKRADITTEPYEIYATSRHGEAVPSITMGNVYHPYILEASEILPKVDINSDGGLADRWLALRFCLAGDVSEVVGEIKKSLAKERVQLAEGLQQLDRIGVADAQRHVIHAIK